MNRRRIGWKRVAGIVAFSLAATIGAGSAFADQKPDAAAPPPAATEGARCNGRVLGAAVGAALGALIGRNMADENRRGAGTGIGAGVGAAIGTLIGREIDRGNPTCSLPEGHERTGVEHTPDARSI